MAEPIISIAIMEPFDGCEQEFVATLEQLYALIRRKGYATDQLFADRKDPKHYYNVRRWISAEARDEAHEDPEVHRYWAQLGHLCRMVKVYQTLDDCTFNFDAEPLATKVTAD